MLLSAITKFISQLIFTWVVSEQSKIALDIRTLQKHYLTGSLPFCHSIKHLPSLSLHAACSIFSLWECDGIILTAYLNILIRWRTCLGNGYRYESNTVPKSTLAFPIKKIEVLWSESSVDNLINRYWKGLKKKKRKKVALAISLIH